jgi:hypothetical protein
MPVRIDPATVGECVVTSLNPHITRAHLSAEAGLGTNPKFLITPKVEMLAAPARPLRTGAWAARVRARRL